MKRLCITVPVAIALLALSQAAAYAQTPGSTGGACRGGAGYSGQTDSNGNQVWQFVAGDSAPAGATDGGCSFAQTDVASDPQGPAGGLAGSAGQLTATGNFACGSGTLTGTGDLFLWDLGDQTFSWSATFKNGVGSFTTTTSNGTPLSGTLTIADGAPASCNDQYTTTPNPLPVGSSGVTQPPVGALTFTLG